MIEIRWHGRGGQGTKTASLLLADIIFNSNKYVQGFPEYGPERKGAPITAYNRIDENEILIHNNIYNPDIVIIVDPTQISKKLLYGLKEGGVVITNSAKEDEEIRKKLELSDDIKLYNINASEISFQNLGAVYPNIPILTATLIVLNIFGEQEIKKYMEIEITKKFETKLAVIPGNIACMNKTVDIMKEKYGR